MKTPEKRRLLLRKAAGAQRTQWEFLEVVRRNIDACRKICNRNGLKLKLLLSIDWRASPVPAAAVIPAPVVYFDVVAVKTLVVRVGFRGCGDLSSPLRGDTLLSRPISLGFLWSALN